MSLSLEERDRRYAGIRELMKKEELDCLVCISRDTYSTRGNTRYVTSCGNPFGEEVVMFPIGEDPSVIAGMLRGPVIERAGWIHNFIPVENVSERIEKTKQELARLDKGNKIGIVGMSYVSVPVYSAVESQCPNRVVDTTGIFDQMRAIKSPEEIEKMRISASIADAALAVVLEMLRPGLSDYEIYGEIKRVIHRMGCEYSMEFPHPTGLVTEANEFYGIEFTPAYEGYYTQILTRLPVVEYPPDMKEFIPVWKVAFAAGLDCLRPGKKVSEVWDAISMTIRDQGGIQIPHRFGHSIGLDAIDSFELVASDTTELKPGMTMAFHPGVGKLKRQFVGGYTYLITDTGAEKLNKVDFVS